MVLCHCVLDSMVLSAAWLRAWDPAELGVKITAMCSRRRALHCRGVCADSQPLLPQLPKLEIFHECSSATPGTAVKACGKKVFIRQSFVMTGTQSVCVCDGLKHSLGLVAVPAARRHQLNFPWRLCLLTCTTAPLQFVLTSGQCSPKHLSLDPGST